MAEISINLLPQEFTSAQKEKHTFAKVQFISIGTILIFVFLASVTISLRILQSRNISTAQNHFTDVSQKVSSFKNTEASLVVLKSRLTAISKITSLPSKQRAVYDLIQKLLPASMQISNLTVASSGDMSISILAPDAIVLDDFITSLITPEVNEDKVSEVSVDNLSRSKDGIYRVSLKVVAK